MITLKRILYTLLALGALIAVLSNLYVWHKERKEYKRIAAIQEARKGLQSQKHEEPTKRELPPHPIEPHRTIHYFPEYLKLFKKALKEKNWTLLHSLSDADRQSEIRYGKPGEIHEDLEQDQNLLEAALKTLVLRNCNQAEVGRGFFKTLKPNEDGDVSCDYEDKDEGICTFFHHRKYGWVYSQTMDDCPVGEEGEITIMGQPLQADEPVRPSR